MPANITSRLSAATERIMSSSEMTGKLDSLGFSVDYRKPGEFSAFMDSETKRYDKIIKSADIKID